MLGSGSVNLQISVPVAAKQSRFYPSSGGEQEGTGAPGDAESSGVNFVPHTALPAPMEVAAWRGNK